MFIYMYVQTDHRDATPNTHTQPQRSVIVLDPALRELKELFLLGVQDKSIQIIDWWIMVNRPIPMILLIPIYFCMYIYNYIYMYVCTLYIYIHMQSLWDKLLLLAIAVSRCCWSYPEIQTIYHQIFHWYPLLLAITCKSFTGAAVGCSQYVIREDGHPFVNRDCSNRCISNSTT